MNTWTELEGFDKKKLTVTLIAEELRSQKLFSVLDQLGGHDSFYHPRLDRVILSLMELDSSKDKIVQRYVQIIDAEVGRVKTTTRSIQECSNAVYKKLKRLRRDHL